MESKHKIRTIVVIFSFLAVGALSNILVNYASDPVPDLFKRYPFLIWIGIFVCILTTLSLTYIQEFNSKKKATRLDNKLRSSLRWRLWGISLAARTQKEVYHLPRIWFGKSRDGAESVAESDLSKDPSIQCQYDIIEIPPEAINANLYIISIIWVKTFTFFGNNPFSTEAIYCTADSEPEARQFAANYAQTRLQPGYHYAVQVWKISKVVLDALYSDKTFAEVYKEVTNV